MRHQNLQIFAVRTKKFALQIVKVILCYYTIYFEFKDRESATYEAILKDMFFTCN